MHQTINSTTANDSWHSGGLKFEITRLSGMSKKILTRSSDVSRKSGWLGNGYNLDLYPINTPPLGFIWLVSDPEKLIHYVCHLEAREST